MTGRPIRDWADRRAQPKRRPISDGDVARLYPQAAEIFGRIRPEELGLRGPFTAEFHIAEGNRLLAAIDGLEAPIVWDQRTGRWLDP